MVRPEPNCYKSSVNRFCISEPNQNSLYKKYNYTFLLIELNLFFVNQISIINWYWDLGLLKKIKPDQILRLFKKTKNKIKLD
jgi:hypothetical protein